MKILSDADQRLLTYVQMAESARVPLTLDQLDHFALGRVRTGAVYADMGRMIEGRPEPASAYLSRIGWLSGQDGIGRLTDLGRAVLRGAEAEDARAATESGVAIILEQGDDFAFATVLAKIGEVGTCLLVDPYLDADSALAVLKALTVARILTGSKGEARLAGLDAVIAGLASRRSAPQVRTTDTIHDRHVVPDHGPVWMLGTSLNGVGARTSSMVRLPDEVESALRSHLQQAWETASPMSSSTATAATASQFEPGEA